MDHLLFLIKNSEVFFQNTNLLTFRVKLFQDNHKSQIIHKSKILVRCSLFNVFLISEQGLTIFDLRFAVCVKLIMLLMSFLISHLIA